MVAAVPDIEDLGEEELKSRPPRPPRVLPAGVRGAAAAEPGPSSGSPGAPSSILPGAQSIWLKTFGCSHNTSDSEYMAGLLTEYGWRCAPSTGAAHQARLFTLPARACDPDRLLNASAPSA